MDEARLHDFMGKLVGDMGAAATLANVILGDELGLYRAMADSQPTTPEALAEKTGCHPRLVREWLSAQAASGYMVHDKGRFVLPEEQAMALALEDSPAYMAGGAAVVAALFHDKDKLVAAMRGDGGLAWGDQGGRCGLWPWRLDIGHGPGVSCIDLCRLRLSRPIHRHRQPARRRGGVGRAGAFPTGHC